MIVCPKAAQTTTVINMRYPPTILRISNNIHKTGTCWNWNGCKTPDGYGLIRHNGPQELAHRASWMVYRGPIPEGMCVLHHCDNPACVNPDHLFLGSHRDNMADCAAKQRIRNGNQKGSSNGHSKLTEQDIPNIRSLSKSFSHSTIAKCFDVSRRTISAVVEGKNWKHV